MNNLCSAICGKHRKFEKPKILYHLGKTLIFLLPAVSLRMKMKKYLKTKSQLKY